MRLEATVTSGAGKVIACGSCIANGSQHPTTLEMDYPPRVPAENSTPSGITGVTAGNGLTGGGTSGNVTLDVAVPLSLQTSSTSQAAVYGDNRSAGRGVSGSSVNGCGIEGISNTGTGAYGSAALAGYAGWFVGKVQSNLRPQMRLV